MSASQPPSGDAPARYPDGFRDTIREAIDAANGLATPAPLDVDRLARALRLTYGSMHATATEADWQSDAFYIARAYANQEGGEPREETK